MSFPSVTGILTMARLTRACVTVGSVIFNSFVWAFAAELEMMQKNIVKHKTRGQHFGSALEQYCRPSLELNTPSESLCSKGDLIRCNKPYKRESAPPRPVNRRSIT
jgi:hypothetical protein